MTDFWSRRRAAVEAEQEAEVAEAVALEEARTEAELEARDDAELLAELNLPEPEALDTPEAVREFMSHTLPQRLKIRALRRLWRLNPVLANLDGLIDYGEDFTDSATVIENLQTAYQVGKGMLKHVEALAAKAEAEGAEDGAGDPTDPDAEPDEVVVAEVEQPDAPTETAEPAAIQTDPDYPEEDMAAAPIRRHMAFSFDTHA